MRFWRLTAFLLLASCHLAWGKPLRITVVSDLNGPYGEISYHERVGRAVTRIRELGPDLVISTGDMIAGQRRFPKLTQAELRRMWMEFHRVVTDPLASSGIPLFVTPGNHDASADERFREERMIYEWAWRMRRPDFDFLDADGYPFQYAFRFDETLFVSLDATRKGPLPSEQLEWLREVLESPEAGSTRIVFGHLPVWPFSRGREKEFLNDPDLRGVLDRLEVDLYLSGHHHAFYPGSDGVTLHVSQACLGSGPRRLIGDSEVSPRAFTLIEIGDDGTVNVEAYRGPDFLETIDLEALPVAIETGQGRLLRFRPSP